jgi:hypothetical protein
MMKHEPELRAAEEIRLRGLGYELGKEPRLLKRRFGTDTPDHLIWTLEESPTRIK